MKKSIWQAMSSIAVSLIISLVSVSPSFSGERLLDNHKEVKNIIFMVPDGMGLADVTAAHL